MQLSIVSHFPFHKMWRNRHNLSSPPTRQHIRKQSSKHIDSLLKVACIDSRSFDLKPVISYSPSPIFNHNLLPFKCLHLKGATDKRPQGVSVMTSTRPPRKTSLGYHICERYSVEVNSVDLGVCKRSAFLTQHVALGKFLNLAELVKCTLIVTTVEIEGKCLAQC